MAWPDQKRAFAALQKLDLLVTMDTEMTATAELSDYVIAPRLTLETPMTTYMPESVKYYGTTRGFPQPYAAYTPSLVELPAGSDVMENWEFFWGLAQRMGTQIDVTMRYGNGPQAEAPPMTFTLDPAGPKPTTDALIELSCQGSRISLEPGLPPRIRPHYLATEHDRRVTVDMVRLMRRLAAAPPLASLIVEETFPGAAMPDEDEAIIAAAHRDQSCAHAVGTCSMGAADDPMAVVDPRLRMLGLEGLRVMDCSVMPTQPSGNTNAPVCPAGNAPSSEAII
nr:GMC oxidoreductase [Sphingobium chlorophenolicum]